MEARARLRARFVAGLGNRLATIEAVRDGIQAEQPSAFAEARTLGHQFAGTGASFGFAELSERGRELEHAADAEVASCIERLIEVVLVAMQDDTVPPAEG